MPATTFSAHSHRLPTSSTESGALQDRQRMLIQHAAEQQRRLQAAARNIQDEGPEHVVNSYGCFPCFPRLRQRCERVPTEVATVCATAQKRSGAFQRLFGSKESAGERLQQAAELLTERIESLEQRVSAARDEAKLRAQSGQKANALRALKRAKMLETSMAQAVTAHSALERQRELFTEAALQKEVTGALAVTMKSMRNTCKGKALANAERAVDEAQEVQDSLTDLGDTLGQFSAAGLSASGADDDDELLAELQQMVEDDAPSTTNKSSVRASTSPVHEQKDTAVHFPNAPVGEMSAAMGAAMGSVAVE